MIIEIIKKRMPERITLGPGGKLKALAIIIPNPVMRTPKITLKLRQPKITLKVKQPTVTLRLQLNRTARRGQTQAPASTTYTGPRTRARARAEAEQAQQGPVTRARSRVNAKVKKVNYRV